MWEKIIKLRPEMIVMACRNEMNYYLFDLAIKNGYVVNENDLRDLVTFRSSSDVMAEAIKVNPNFIKYCNRSMPHLIYEAIKRGYKPNMEDLESNIYLGDYRVINYLIDNGHPEALKYSYDGLTGIKVFKALKKYKPTMEDLVNNPRLGYIDPVMAIIIKEDVNALTYLDVEDQKSFYKFVKYALNNGYHPNIELIKGNKKLCSFSVIFELLLKEDCNNIRYYTGFDERIFKLALELGYEPNLKDCKLFYGPNFMKSDVIMSKLIEKDPSIITSYKGDNASLFVKSIELGYKVKKDVTQTDLIYDDDYDINNRIIYMLKNNDFSFLKKLSHINNYRRLFKIAFDYGYTISANECDGYFYNIMSEKSFKRMVDSSGTNSCFELIYRFNLSDQQIDYILKSKHIIVPLDYIKLSKLFGGNKFDFMTNYSKVNMFLKELDIDDGVFFQYAFSPIYNVFLDIISIMDSEKIVEFSKVKDYFFENYYLNNMSNVNNAVVVKSLINIIKNYMKYPELCLDIVDGNINIEGELLEKINYLFEVNIVLNEDYKPKKVSDINKVNELFLNNYLEEIDDIEAKTIEDIKNILCHQLFNLSLSEAKSLLLIYGNTSDLRQLQFDNRENLELVSFANEMMIYTTMMEAIIESEDRDYLIEVAKKISDCFQLSSRCMMLFTRFDENMQDLYSNELSSNLTILRNDVSLDSLKDIKMSEDCGVDVLDFSDKQYCLLAHVKSQKESVEDIVNGKSSGSVNYISLSAISHRNQVYYAYNKGDIIFGYDSIPDGSFIKSSVSNFGTNSSVMYNSAHVPEINRRQRGILKTSTAPNGNNSEILCFRDEVKPKYIILPGGRKPTKQEIEIAKEYNLKFVKTQKIHTPIRYPIKIDDELLEHKDQVSLNTNEEGVKPIKDFLSSSGFVPRKIAIFTDSHALFEPTLAILEDARKSGIREIYSLGDNIGTGPNPREVVDLLDEYGVISLSGNHEIYATLGVDTLKDHFKSTDSLEQARRNSSWTRTKLTEEQVDKIRKTPESIVIEIGGKQIFLTHFFQDYVTGEKLELPSNISHVFQGHRHFEDDDEFVTTLRAAGIGNSRGEEGMASYIVLVERPDGGYDVERHVIPYDYSSLRYDINESDMFSDDKDKIERWVSVTR